MNEVKRLAELHYKRGNEDPYDKGDAEDWTHKAARGICHDLLDRRGIKWEFEKVDDDVRVEIVEALAEIIRAAFFQE